jgi:preprotein translocase subunit YajC
MENIVAFVFGSIVTSVVWFFVLRNQVRKHEELRTYVDQVEAGAREYADELWDDVSGLKAKVAEVYGRLNK